MSYQVELKPSGISPFGWHWTVILPDGFIVSDYTFTKAGALWSIQRGIKEHKRYLGSKDLTEKWEIE
jgi:hypothetical protein